MVWVRLLEAIQVGNFETVQEIVNTHGLSQEYEIDFRYVIRALKCEQIEIAKFLISHGARVNSEDKTRCETPLHLAIQFADIELVKMILDNGGYVNVDNKCDREHPLHYAILKNEHEITELLLKHGAEVNKKCRSTYYLCERPLHIAVSLRHRTIVEQLLNYGADINLAVERHKKETPLHIAVLNDDNGLVSLLLERGAVADCTMDDGFTPLHVAVKNNNIDVVKELLKYNACTNISSRNDKYSPLHVSCKISIEIVKLLLNAGADVCSLSEDLSTPLHLAARAGKINHVKILLEHGALVDCVDANGNTPLLYAVEKNNAAVVKNFLKNNACTNISSRNDKFSPLHVSCKISKCVGIVKLLLNAGADVCSLSEDLSTPLHLAARAGKINHVKILLEHGALVNCLDATGKTPLWYAVEKNNAAVVKEILKSVPDINNPGNSRCLQAALQKLDAKLKKVVEFLLGVGFSLEPGKAAENPAMLHGAVQIGNLQLVEDLLHSGADVNAIHNRGFTPLHRALKRKHIHVARFLINQNADVNAADQQKRTPIYYAIKTSDYNNFKLLLENGGDINDEQLWYYAVGHGSAKIVNEFLHQKDLNLDAINFAAKRGATNICKLLLKEGADANSITSCKKSALYQASEKGHNGVAKLLLDYGTDENFHVANYGTALHAAAENDHKAVIRVLVKYGADINFSWNGNIEPPLHIAAKKSCADALSTLLEYGADVNLAGRTYNSPLVYAYESLKSFLDGEYYEVSDIENESWHKYLSHHNYHQPSKNHLTIYELHEHLVRMKVANLFISLQNEKALAKFGYYYNHEKEHSFEVEVCLMKDKTIGDTVVSYYDMLRMSPKKMGTFMRNESVRQTFRTGDFKSEFPIYAGMLTGLFQRGLDKYELLEKAHRSFRLLFKNFPALPLECIETITSFLSDQDLWHVVFTGKKLISSFTPS